jgi:hypothetical protein
MATACCRNAQIVRAEIAIKTYEWRTRLTAAYRAARLDAVTDVKVVTIKRRMETAPTPVTFVQRANVAVVGAYHADRFVTVAGAIILNTVARFSNIARPYWWSTLDQAFPIGRTRDQDAVTLLCQIACAHTRTTGCANRPDRIVGTCRTYTIAVLDSVTQVDT